MEPWPPFGPVIRPIISQTNNGCSLLLLIFAKLLLLDVSCENIFALCIVTALTACPFSIKKCATMSVFYVQTLKVCWRLEATPPHPRLCPPLPNPGCATDGPPSKLRPQVSHLNPALRLHHVVDRRPNHFRFCCWLLLFRHFQKKYVGGIN